MAKRRINRETIALVAGFMIFMLGILVIIGRPASLRTTLLSVAFADNTWLDLFGLILIFGGGLIGILGVMRLVKSISNDVVNIVYVQHVSTKQDIENLKSFMSDRLATKQDIENLKSPISNRAAPTAQVSKYKCKFCGANIAENAVFCPICNKSQI